MKVLLCLGVMLIATCAESVGAASGTGTPAAAGADRLDYLPDGRLRMPADYRDWPFLSSGLDMNYQDGGMRMDHGIFDNVFVNPESLRSFRESGKWPERTVFVKEGREALTKGSINKSGQYQAEAVISVEIHVKDSARFDGGWGFFAFDGAGPAVRIPAAADCYACHQAHGGVDSTFVQFYPTLVGIARRKGTLHAAR
jgi:hypothetical protein